MKIYIAAPWANREEARHASKLVEAQGHTITWPWWEHEGKGWKSTPEELAIQAGHDVTGVRDAEVVILLNSAKSEGKATEQGMAIAWEKPIIGVGHLGDKESMNVFHWLPVYNWVATIEEAIHELSTL